MAKRRSIWTKRVLHALIDRDMSVAELASKMHPAVSREYFSSVVYGRIISERVSKQICDFLNLPDEGYLPEENK